MTLDRKLQAARLLRELADAFEREARATPNLNCDGSGPHEEGEVRVLPTGERSNALLCHACFEREIAWRKERNPKVAQPFDLPEWGSLEVYGGG